MILFFILFLLPSVLALVTPIQKRNSLSLPIISRRQAGPNVAENDRTRLRKLTGQLTGKQANSSTNTDSDSSNSGDVETVNGGTAFTVSLAVGSPPTNYELIVDTGSSNTWVGANTSHPYVRTSTSVDTGQALSVIYGIGFFKGIQFFDMVSLNPNLVVNQSIGVATSTSDFDGVDGILGIGPTDLTLGRLVDSLETTIPTIVDSMQDQGVIQKRIVSIFFIPTFGDDSGTEVGSINFGELDTSHAVGPVTSVPITKTFPSDKSWGVDASLTLAGQQEPIFGTTAGIVDTGTRLFPIPPDAFQRYQDAVGAHFDNTTGFLKISKENFEVLPSLFLNIGGRDFEITADAQAWPQQLNQVINGEPDDIYLIVTSTNQTGNGLDFLIGQVILQRFMSFYDSDEQRVGFAYTKFTNAIINVP